MFTTAKLKNHVNVILVPQKDTQSVTVLVMYPVGSRYEPEKLAGVSHYIEHLMFKGTKKRKSTLILTREIDRLGAEYNAFTGKEYTAYYIKIDAEYATIALDILSDMLFNSLFDAKEMEREKGPIIEELRMYKDNPLINIDNLFEETLYAGCPLGRDIGGTESQVKSYRRDEVLAYRRKYYVPSNMTVVVAGRVEEKTKSEIEHYFGAAPIQPPPAQTFKPYCFSSAKKERRLVIQKKATDQAQLMLGFPGFAYAAKENAALTALNTILGGSMSSRLFIQIRERRGLAYMIKSGDDHFRDTGYVYVRAGLEAKNINKAMNVIRQEIDKLKDKAVSKSELNDAKTHLRGAITLSLEDSSVQANWYAREALFYDKIKTPDERLAEIDRVTSGDIQRVARQVFRMNQMRVAVIGEVERERLAFSV